MEFTIDKNFSGCILVIKSGEIIFKKSSGYSDLPNKIPNMLDTRFATASAGKVFVAVAILQLIEKGKLDFKSRIGELLDFDLKAIDENITVEQLLTHTSGIPDYFDESVMDDYSELWTDFPNYKIRSSADLIPLFINKPMMYPAGDRFQYNDTGYVVLGLIIEAVTGMPFDEYLNKNVFAPCGMTDTGYYELDRLPDRCANSYIYDNVRGGYYTNIYSVDVKGTGAGGAYTTVYDIQKFWNNLINGKLISKEMFRNMISIYAGSDDLNYGYGIWLKKDVDDSIIPYFEGCDPGVSFVTSYDSKNDICIIAVSNFCCDVWSIHRNIANEIRKNNEHTSL